jgi:CRP/FNR family cyclic AMP-dependent transcriptional regulator
MVPVETLRSLWYFAGVSPETLRAVASLTDEHEFQAGQILWREGQPVESMLIVRRGEVDVIYQLQDRQQRVVDSVVGGELSGWSALVEPYQHTATCIARSAGSALHIETTGLRALCERDHTLGYRLFAQVAKTLSSRLEGARLQLAAAPDPAVAG